jgi:hypothetical protein
MTRTVTNMNVHEHRRWAKPPAPPPAEVDGQLEIWDEVGERLLPGPDAFLCLMCGEWRSLFDLVLDIPDAAVCGYCADPAYR